MKYLVIVLLLLFNVCFAASEELEEPIQTGVIQKIRPLHFYKRVLLTFDEDMVWMLYPCQKSEPGWLDWWRGHQPTPIDPRLECNPLFWKQYEEIQVFATSFEDSKAIDIIDDDSLLSTTHILYNVDRNELAFARCINHLEMNHYEFWPRPIQTFPKKTLKIKLDDIIGYNQAKAKLKKLSDNFEPSKPYLKLGAQPPYGVFITGPSGSGKSLIAKAFAGELNRTLIRISGDTFWEQLLLFNTNWLSSLFDQARLHAPSMILIDGFDANKHLQNTLLYQFCMTKLKREMGNCPKIHDVLITMTIRDIHSLSEEFLQYHSSCPIIRVDPPSQSERKDLIDQIAHDYELADDCDLNMLSFQTASFAPKDLCAVFQEAAKQAAHFARLKITQLDLQAAVRAIAHTKAEIGQSGENPAKLSNPLDTPVLFKDVGGCYEAKEEFKEIVSFLKNSKQFSHLGAKAPKGILCYGPPGCGKTLLARAVAGEAGCNFFYCGGADFTDVWVASGVNRVKAMFKIAKANTPAILFIDEIDALGGQRTSSTQAASRDFNNTLNQLLVEMDGFDGTSGLVVMGATNRPNMLDTALTRSGRFDRSVIIDLPHLAERLDILKIHSKKSPLDPSVDLKHTARMTMGMSGADLANMVNEAALIAARNERDTILTSDLRSACDKVQLGKERSSLQLTEEQKKQTAYHEVGHALVGILLDSGWEVDKVTIVPRGVALGTTHSIPKGENTTLWKSEAQNLLAVKLGGLAAEKLFIGDGSSGVQSDLQSASELARTMVTKWGMSERLGLATYDDDLSFETKRIIDMEVRDLLDTAYQRAKNLLKKHENDVHEIVKQLLKKETLYRSDLDLILES